MAGYILFIAMSLIIGMFGVPVQAADNAHNEVTVQYNYDDVNIEGMSVKLYKVATLTKEGSFEKTSSFKDSSADLNEYRDVSGWQDIAEQLSSYILKNKISTQTDKKTNSKGNAVIKNLSDGLYLVAPSGYIYDNVGYIAQPVIFELPVKNNDDITRKIIIDAKLKAVKPELVEDEMGKYAAFYDDGAAWLNNSKDNDREKLPQTGQLWWPVSILAVSGMVFIIAGFVKLINKNIRRFLWSGGIICIGCAISLFVYNNIQDNKVRAHNVTALDNYEQAMLTAGGYDSPVDISMMQSLDVDGTDYIGVIDIPKTGVKLPVQSECTDKALGNGPCLYSGTCGQDNMIIAGHNMRSVFNGIRHLEAGDVIKFTDVTGVTHNYLVHETEVIDGYDCERMLNGDWALTLFTCTYGGRERIAVRCVRSV